MNEQMLLQTDTGVSNETSNNEQKTEESTSEQKTENS